MMKNCTNHPDMEALSVCNSCGKYYCELCLDEGNEYYYCRKPECQTQLKEERSAFSNTHTKENPVNERLVILLSSLNAGDIAFVKSVLDNGNIDYFCEGENFLTMRPLVEPARFFVKESQLEEAKELLKDLDLNIFGVSFNR